LNGSIKIAPIILKTTPSVNPTIAKGSNISQKNMRIKNKPTAKGQHRVNNMQKSNTAINNFISANFFICLKSNIKPEFLIILLSVNCMIY